MSTLLASRQHKIGRIQCHGGKEDKKGEGKEIGREKGGKGKEERRREASPLPNSHFPLCHCCYCC